jgi:hypothetical protein
VIFCNNECFDKFNFTQPSPQTLKPIPEDIETKLKRLRISFNAENIAKEMDKMDEIRRKESGRRKE